MTIDELSQATGLPQGLVVRVASNLQFRGLVDTHGTARRRSYTLSVDGQEFVAALLVGGAADADVEDEDDEPPVDID